VTDNQLRALFADAVADGPPEGPPIDQDLARGRALRTRVRRRRIGGGSATLALIVAGALATPISPFSLMNTVESGDEVASSGPCPVTAPARPGFEPPAPYPAVPHSGDLVWFGTEELWTALPVGDDYGTRKSVWWSNRFGGGSTEPTPQIDVTWERLDLDVDPIHNDGHGTNAHTAEDGWFMIAGGDPPEPGCWRVTAVYRGHSLSYVYDNR
jgi:hypothetical protein